MSRRFLSFAFLAIPVCVALASVAFGSGGEAADKQGLTPGEGTRPEAVRPSIESWSPNAPATLVEERAYDEGGGASTDALYDSWLDQFSMRAAEGNVNSNEAGYGPEMVRALMGANGSQSSIVTQSSGNLPYKVVDFSEEGGAGLFKFTRVYNATSGRVGWMGYKWTHCFEMCVYEEVDSDVLYLDADGRVWTFAYSGGSYTSPPNLYATMTKNSGSTTERWKITFKDGRKFYFRSANGCLTKIEDASGNTITFTYGTANDCITKVTDELGRIYSLSYRNDVGVITKVTDFAGRYTEYRYDTVDYNLTKVVDFNGKITHYRYDPDDNLTKVTTPTGSETFVNSYDTYGRVTKQRWDGNDLTLAYTPASDKTEVYDRENRHHEYHYSSGDEALVDQYKVYTGGVNGGDPASFTSNYSYDTQYNVTKIVVPDGTTGKFLYDANGNITEFRGQTTDTTPSESDYVYTFLYNASNRLTTQTDELGRTTTSYYDANGNCTKVTHPSVTLGVTQTIEETWAYDSGGRATKFVDGEGGVTESEYYTTGANNGYLKKKTIDPGEGHLAIAHQYEYDPRGNLTKYTDPEGYVSNAWYDAMDRMTKSVSASYLDKEYYYNDNGSLTRENTETSDGTNPWYSHVYYRDTYGQVTKESRETMSATYADTTYVYDKNGRLTKATDPMGAWSATVYDERGYVYQSLEGYSGTTVATTSYTYDGDGRTTKVVDPLSNSSYSYHDASGKLTKSADTLGNYSVNSYDDMGRVTMARQYDSADTLLSQSREYFDEVGRTYRSDSGSGTVATSYTYYDKSGSVTKTTSPSSSNMYQYYDVAGRVTKATDARGKDTTFAYDKNGNTTLSTDPIGNSVTNYYTCCGSSGGCGGESVFSCSLAGKLTKVVYPDNSTVTYLYDILSRQTKVTDQVSGTTYAYYDGLGRVTKATNAASGDTITYYDAAGKVTKTTDALGKNRVSYYDGMGRLTKSEDPLTNYSAWSYDVLGRKTLVTDAEGRTSKTYYDAVGRVTKSEDGLGKYTLTYYDGLGRTTKVTDPLARNVYTYYNDLGSVTKAENPLGKITTFAYDLEGRRTLATDANSKSSLTYYDAGGLATKTVDAVSRAVVLAYDDAGRKTALTDANSHATAFAYDKLARLTKLTYPNSDAESYVFDAAGRMTAKTTPNNATIAYAYSPTGLMTLKTYPGPSTVSYYFDADGRRTQVVDANTDNAYYYDDAGKLTKVSDAKYSPAKDIVYSYDKTGARTLMDRPSGDDITYFYDARGAMTLVKEGASNRATYYFDDAGGPTKTLLGNSSYTEYLYSGAGSLTLLSNKKSDATLISGFAYGVDDTGNRTKMSVSGSAYTSADIAYTYDDAYQLTGEVRTGGNAYSQYFYYDPNGNRTKSTLGGADTTYLYNTGDQLTSETAGGVTTTYLYDANGALTKSDDATTVNAYTYDYDGYQTAFDTTGTSNDATYAYDADKRRINKVVDSVTTKYFLDGADVIADYDGSDALVATYVTPGIDMNVSQTRSGSTYYYMKDGLGSVRNLVDSSEATQNTYDYYAFGKELGNWTQNVTSRYTYTAREYDPEAKQYYYRARTYGAEGIFAQRDAIVASNGVSLYTYAENNPVRYSDPSGFSPTLSFWGIPYKGVAATLKEGRFGDKPSGYCDQYTAAAVRNVRSEKWYPVTSREDDEALSSRRRRPYPVFTTPSTRPPMYFDYAWCVDKEIWFDKESDVWDLRQLADAKKSNRVVKGTLLSTKGRNFSVAVEVDEGIFHRYKQVHIRRTQHHCACYVLMAGMLELSGDDGAGNPGGFPDVPFKWPNVLVFDRWTVTEYAETGKEKQVLKSGVVLVAPDVWPTLTTAQQEKLSNAGGLGRVDEVVFK